MNLLMENKDKEFRVTEIAEKTGIDVKNMGRYIKQLDEEQRIKIHTTQEGKVRTKFVSFAESPKTKILDETAGQADREKDAEPTSPREIKNAEPPKAKKEIVKPVTKLDANEILLKLQSKKVRDSPAYSNMLKQLQKYGKKVIIIELVNFINTEIL